MRTRALCSLHRPIHFPRRRRLPRSWDGPISRAIDALPRDQRITLVTIDIQGLSYEETAEAFGVSIGTVKSRLSRARSKVRDLLARETELFAGAIPSRVGEG